jgi:hypothetical protein
MPKFADHPTINRVKLLLCGDPGSGKTGSLATLANAGYHVHIVDLDNNLAIIKNYLKPDAPGSVDYVSIAAKEPTSWNKAVGYLDKWDDGTDPKTWDAKHVLVIDSATFLNEVLFNSLAAKKNIVVEDAQAAQLRDIYNQQFKYFETLVAKLCGDKYKCHIVMTAHLRWLGGEDKPLKCYPAFMGQQLPDKVSRYMNNVWLAERRGGTPVFQTQATPVMTLKCSAPAVVQPKEDFDLGAIFKKMGA